jgi:hypothetical protein
MRLRQCSILLLQLSEQAHVLNGDDRLVRKGFHEFDLRGCERLHLVSTTSDRADRHAVPEDGNAEERTIPRRAPQDLSRSRIVIRICLDILDVHWPRIDEGPTDNEVTPRWPRKHSVVCRVLGGRHIVDRHKMEQPALEARHRTEIGTAQLSRVCHDGVEDRLSVRR